MLKPKYLEQLPNSMIELFSQAEQDILADMARRISKYDYWIPSVEHQRKKLVELGNFHSFILKALSSRTGKTEEELKRLMQEAGQEALSFDIGIYEERGLDPPPLPASKAQQAVLTAGYKKTAGLFRNLTSTTANTATKQFEDALDRAYMQITTGAFDYGAAIRTAIKDLARQGVGAIQYPSGHVDTIEVAVRRAAVTGVNQTALQLQSTLADEMGCDLVETTAHAGARPEHTIWQGRVFSRSGKSEKYPDFVRSTGYGTGSGLGGWNCHHSFFPYFDGSPQAYTPELLAQYEAKDYEYNGRRMTEYEATQQQRYIERQIRRWKREYTAMDAAGLDTGESAAKIRSWQERQKDFLKQTGLKRQAEREQTHEFGRAEARKAAHEAEIYYQLWSKSIGVDNAVKTLAKYYDIKYNDSPTYELLKIYVQDVESSWISPNADFGNYLKQYSRIQSEIVGTRTKNGIFITGQSQHFMQRVLGTMSDPGHDGAIRSGVLIDDIQDTLRNPIDIGRRRKTTNGKVSIKFTGKRCQVSVNPDDGMLIQVNPRRG